MWFIFDEWDEALTFSRRPQDLQLPELEAFRDHSFHADRAYSPTWETIISIPSLLVGKTFVAQKPKGANDLLMTYDRAGAPVSLSSAPTVFSAARAAGFNVGIVGYYLPYCRMFDSQYFL